MFYEKMSVLDFTDATLTAYIPHVSSEIDENVLYEAIVICPGGGYQMCSEREAEPIALAFAGEGKACFLLNYSVAPAKDIYPNAILEVSKSIAMIRENAEKWHIDTDKIYVIGFSAGGHLAACAATMWSEDFITEALDIPYGSNKPNGVILGYPVITATEQVAHAGSYMNLLEGKNTEANREYLSLENRVSEKTPPVFMWHTFDDTTVNVLNSMKFATACKEFNIPCEMHIFPFGKHGLSLADKRCTKSTNSDLINPHAAKWFELCLDWLDLMSEQ